MNKGENFDAPAPRGRQESGQSITGRIVRLVRGKGQGVILAEDGRELFFHRGNVTAGWFNDLKEGDLVECEAITNLITGPRAVKVRKAESRG